MSKKTFLKKFDVENVYLVKEKISKEFGEILHPEPTKSNYELFRFSSYGGTLVIYKSGKVLLQHDQLDFIEDFLISMGDEQKYDVLIGIDETGKGELFGNIIICGVKIQDRKNEIERIVSTINTKGKVGFEKYESIFDRLIEMGVEYVIEEIPNEELNYGNMYSLMIRYYLLVLNKFVEKGLSNKTRVTIDDFGIKEKDKQTIINKCINALVIIENKADDNYLECKVASIISRYHREVFLKKINEEYVINGEFPGSGNVSDPKTIRWIKMWVSKYGSLPSFVKRWYKTVDRLIHDL
ncbi:MAG: hypothetical protein N2712_05810 [Brevinematales bacterium]|nr:hypothetical protein [Brevinematales bacterium]